MASKGWKEHIFLPSPIGEPEEERPVFIGPSPTLLAQRRYIRNYLRWATGTTQEWEDDQRSQVELSMAKTYADQGIESFGKYNWECSVNEILWKLSFSSLPEKKVPAFPWVLSKKVGGISETYMFLKNRLRAELAYAVLAQEQALEGSTSHSD